MSMIPVMLYVKGKRFHCPRCKASVFTKLSDRYVCNGCGTGYR